MKAKSTGIRVVGGVLTAFGVHYFFSPPLGAEGTPTHDEISLAICGWLILSGMGLIAQLKPAFIFYLIGLAMFVLKFVVGGLNSGHGVLETLLFAAILAVVFGWPAMFVWARSEYLKPWFAEDTQ
ncbi:MAG: hypothetical protein HOO94_02085 [Novosphingobium sp.]|nr:hypothetical protein [Novosphingobium sp.]